ncbi:MAG TPA: acyl-ACP--UDP-N-acetylglucosamine O-acyltransferase [Terriglobales bacterium]|nr:acyl-ACP--UDP-N-acetylglucosamine O-acyltransferase [Terriglobales bacterium]
MAIHPTAVVDRRAEIDATAEIGPFVVIEGPVTVGPRTRLQAHTVILGTTELGADNVVHAGAVIGDTPQDRTYDGAISRVRIGDRNVIREHVQIHRGTRADSVTVVGDDNYLMASAHVAHNCAVGNEVTIANGSMLGGHVQVADRVFIGGNSAVHQHVVIGRLAFLRGGSRADKDVPPFAMMDELNIVRGINRIGLQRAGFEAEQIRALHRAFRVLFFRRRNLRQALAELPEIHSAEVLELIEFLRRPSKRGVCHGPPA